MNNTAIYMIGISSPTGKKGALLVEFDSKPDIALMRVDAEGEDIKLMELNKFYTAKEMIALGY